MDVKYILCIHCNSVKVLESIVFLGAYTVIVNAIDKHTSL